ncbi:UNKNOWN [Stylonychia lemnae]|uniref:Uncharacterized protein n=1 Tax=Stylonychia lemnae TaxID=5949 RepID=A0A078B220_STYLE|nr:UNKNOWN [Stylonychia lemnae]|eukprot:CDW87327.1 UNKNOWN [Stylonychia lemnae]
MLLSETIDMDTAEERWRRLIAIWLRINGKQYAETFNLSINLSLNLAIFLVKYLKIKGDEAEKLAFYEIYALFKEKHKGIIKDTQFISEGDILDLVKLKDQKKYDIYQIEKTELTSGTTFNFFKKKRDSKFLEHSWQISSMTENYQNQQIIDSQENGGLMNCRNDIKKLIDMFQEFKSLDLLFKFIKKIQDKSQIELRVAEFRGFKGNSNTIEVFCPHRPNCKFQIVYRYFLEFRNDNKVHEKIVFDRVGQLVHYHQERLEMYKLGKMFLKMPKGERVP